MKNLNGRFIFFFLLIAQWPHPVSAQYHDFDETLNYRRDTSSQIISIGMAVDTFVMWKGIKEGFAIDVKDLRAPCNIDGSIWISSDPKEVLIQKKSRSTFWIEPHAARGTLHVFYEIDQRIIDIGEVTFSTVVPDTNDADFIKARPTFEWQNRIQDQESYNPDPEKVEEDSNYVLSIGYPIVEKLYREGVNDLQVHLYRKCNPRMPLWLEGEGMEIRKLKGWNEFRIKLTTDDPLVKIRFFVLEDAKKVFLKELEFEIAEGEMPH